MRYVLTSWRLFWTRGASVLSRAWGTEGKTSRAGAGGAAVTSGAAHYKCGLMRSADPFRPQSAERDHCCRSHGTSWTEEGEQDPRSAVCLHTFSCKTKFFFHSFQHKCYKLLRNVCSPAGYPGASGCGRGRHRGRRLCLRPGEERLRPSRTVDTWGRSRAPWSGYYCCCCLPVFIHCLCVCV